MKKKKNVEEKKGIKKIIDAIKKFFGKKKNKIIAIVLAVIIIITILVLIFVRKNDRFALNEMYNIYPKEVRELYSNIVSVSCYGDLHLDVSLDAEATDVSKMSRNNLLDYMFSYLDKNNKLSDSFDIALINDVENKLFLGDIKPFDNVKIYNYGNYQYTIKGRNITRKVRKCESEDTYVSHLYGYSWNGDRLSMDVNVGYMKDNILYDYNDNKLGAYDGNVTKLPELMTDTTYYRFIFYKKDGLFKLSSVQHKNRV